MPSSSSSGAADASPGAQGERAGERAPRSRAFWALLSLGLLALGAGIAALMVVLRPEPASTAPRVQPPLVEVASVRARVQPLIVEGHGVVSPREQLALTAEVAGKIDHVHGSLIEGGSFEEGDLLVRIEPERYETALKQLQAQARAAEASLSLARRELERIRPLYEKGYLAQMEFDAAKNRVEELEATVAAQQAAAALAEVDVGDTTIVAPFRGRVQQESVAEGQFVTAGEKLADIYPTDAFEVNTRLEDEEAALVAGLWRPTEQAARVPAEVIAREGNVRLVWQAHVDRVTGLYAPEAQTVGIVVVVPDPLEPGTPESGEAPASFVPLLPGRFVEVEIEAEVQDGVLAVPVTALHGDVVWEVVDGRVYLRPVEIVQRGDETVFVRSESLSPGAAVVTSPLDIVTEGMPVRIREGGALA